MTDEQQTQLRAHLGAEGHSPRMIEVLVADFRTKPKLLERQLREWKLAAEAKQQQSIGVLLARRRTVTSPSGDREPHAVADRAAAVAPEILDPGDQLGPHRDNAGTG